MLDPSVFTHTAGEHAPQQLSKELIQEVSTRLGQLDDEAIAEANERMSRPKLAVYALTDPDAESPGQVTALGWACRFPPEWTDVLRAELPHGARDWRDKSTRIGIVGPSENVWNIDHPIVRAATADGTAWARAEISEYWRHYDEKIPVDLKIIMSSQSFAVAWLSNCGEMYFRKAWEGLEASVREAIWRTAFNLGPTTPLAGRRMLIVHTEYGSVSSCTLSAEKTSFGLDALPKPPEQWWLAPSGHDEPS